MDEKRYQDTISHLLSIIPRSIVDTTKQRIRGRRPTQAFSQFITNREQGNWAESFVQTLINDNVSELKAVKYGKSDDIIAGDPEFPRFYDAYQCELDALGKKPDILVFDNSKYQSSWGLDISGKTEPELDPIVKMARVGLEVRSSAYLVSKYEQSADKEKFLGFTPKAEDLLIIGKWVEKFGVPHFYVQVFFDRIYMISFQKIIEIITQPTNSPSLFRLDKNAKNQFKSTIHININQGILLANDVSVPEHNSEVKELSRGRLLYYVKFGNSKATFNTTAFLDAIQI